MYPFNRTLKYFKQDLKKIFILKTLNFDIIYYL